MANPHQIIIEGLNLKEVRCKNESCRMLLGWENVAIGAIAYRCMGCQEISVFRMQYKSHAKPLIDKLEERFGKEVSNNG